ncbi:hypothetical protein QBC38DRAFT_45785 [Podospora fimiseda]|uniref:BTB domain-containing protein n=1 Tax=Podospora fimiseda TaxID=252190 RepID=A0AAN7BHX1_9PEZI|nr:hypothetical protein QBC38DRAFT_45785 [Podospora fimiseda]
MSDSLHVVVVVSPFANLASLYEVDPDADTLLIVPPSNQKFAPWDVNTPHQQVNGIVNSTAAAPPASRPGLRIKVSSKHLALSSKIFKNKLQFGASKAVKQSDGRIHLQLAEGFDPKAVSIVLNAIHGKGSKIPKTVDLDTLAQIAVFVDRFQLFDALEVYGDRWISKLEDNLPNVYGRDLVLWIYVSHVFRNSEVLKTVSRTAVAGSDGPIKTLGLPIREKIIRDIDTQRQALVSEAITILHNTLDKLTSGSADCTKYHCDSFLLGELIKTLRTSRLVWPRPEKPFNGFSFQAIVRAVSATFQSQGRGLAVNGDLWSYPGVTNGSRDKLNGNNSNGRSRVGGKGPITPEASPEPVARGGYFETHSCEARKLVWRLDDLDALEDKVEGLDLEGTLGYRNY